MTELRKQFKKEHPETIQWHRKKEKYQYMQSPKKEKKRMFLNTDTI